MCLTGRSMNRMAGHFVVALLFVALAGSDGDAVASVDGAKSLTERREFLNHRFDDLAIAR